jgi:hypothetical protein
MNTRIKELVAEAGMGTWGDFETSNPDNVVESINKFAALIVKECCSLMEQAQDDITAAEPSEVNWGYVSQLQDWVDRFTEHFKAYDGI